jgi:hypothetical protein
LEYYGPQAEASGVRLSAETFEAPWRAWTAAEETTACLDATEMLRSAYGLEDSALMRRWRPTAAAILTRSPRPEGLEPLHGQLLQHASGIDDQVARLRTTQAYWVAATLEWVERVTGVYPRDLPGITAALVTWALTSGEHVSGAVKNVHEVEAALNALEEDHPRAFGSGVSSATVGRLIKLIAEARHTTPKPEAVIETLSKLTARSPEEGTLGCIVTAAVLGPELSRQLAMQLPRGNRESSALAVNVEVPTG